jgi:hypothetical protein
MPLLHQVRGEVRRTLPLKMKEPVNGKPLQTLSFGSCLATVMATPGTRRYPALALEISACRHSCGFGARPLRAAQGYRRACRPYPTACCWSWTNPCWNRKSGTVLTIPILTGGSRCCCRHSCGFDGWYRGYRPGCRPNAIPASCCRILANRIGGCGSSCRSACSNWSLRSAFCSDYLFDSRPWSFPFHKV